MLGCFDLAEEGCASSETMEVFWASALTFKRVCCASCYPPCSLPADTTGYDVSACDASAAAPVRESECAVSCTPGYESDVVASPRATCSRHGNGVFALAGCDACGARGEAGAGASS